MDNGARHTQDLPFRGRRIITRQSGLCGFILFVMFILYSAFAYSDTACELKIYIYFRSEVCITVRGLFKKFVD